MGDRSAILNLFFDDDVKHINTDDIPEQFENNFLRSETIGKEDDIRHEEEQLLAHDEKPLDTYTVNSSDTEKTDEGNSNTDRGDGDFNWTSFSIYNGAELTRANETTSSENNQQNAIDPDRVDKERQPLRKPSKNKNNKHAKTNQSTSKQRAAKVILQRRLHVDEDGWCLTEDDLRTMKVWGSNKMKHRRPPDRPVERTGKRSGRKGRHKIPARYRSVHASSPMTILTSLAKCLGGDLDNLEELMEKQGILLPYLPCMHCYEGSGTKTIALYRRGTAHPKEYKNCQKCGEKLTHMSTLLKDVREFYKCLDEKAFQIHDVSPDGNCQFEAVVDQLRVKGDFRYNAEELRQAAVQYLRENPCSKDGMTYEAFMTSETWPEYLDRMSEDGEWGDHIMLMAMTNVLQAKIVVYSDKSGNNTTEIVPVTLTGHADGSHSCVDVLNIGHVGQSHYVSLRSKDWFNICQAEDLHEDVTNLMPFPIELVDVLLNQLMGAGALQMMKFSLTKLSEPRTGMRAVLVGPCFNEMHPSPYSEEKGYYGDETEVKKNIRSLPIMALFLPNDSKVTEDRQRARNIDLIPLGRIDDIFRLEPIRPKHWKAQLTLDEDHETLTWLTLDEHPESYVPDTIISFQTDWPEVAMEWITRHRKTNCLDGKTIQRILDKGCEITPTLSRKSLIEIFSEYVSPDMAYKRNTWYVSFLLAEKAVCKKLSAYHKMCYAVAKSWVGPHLTKHGLPNAMLTSTFYYACENVDEIVWKTSPGQCVLILLKKLADGFRMKVLPDYFMASRNLLRNVPDEVIDETKIYLEQQLTNPLLGIYVALDKLKITSSNLSFFVESIMRKAMAMTTEDRTEKSSNSFLNLSFELIANSVEQYKFMKALTALDSLQELLNTTFDLHQSISETFIQATAKLELSDRWCFALLVDVSRGTRLTKELCRGRNRVPITHVFGPEAVNLIIDTDIPEEALIENGNVLYPYAFGTSFMEVCRYKPVVCCLKFYLTEYTKLAQGSIMIPVTGKNALDTMTNFYLKRQTAKHGWSSASSGTYADMVATQGVLSILCFVYIILFNSCVSTKRLDEFVEFISQLRVITKVMGDEYISGQFRQILAQYGQIDESMQRGVLVLRKAWFCVPAEEEVD